jgi:hypothetical protein
MKKIPLYLLLCIVLLATGCPNQPSKDLNNKDAIATHINNYLTDMQEDYNNAATDAAKQRIRNDAVEKVLAMVDSNYQDYITRLSTRRATTDFLADVIELGTGAATGIAKGERPNQILGIALTAFRGGRRSGELNFYREQTTPILITKMDDGRSRIYAGILQKKSKPPTDYSLTEAIRDMVAYYNAGTLIRAFTELSKDASTSAAASENAVRVLRGDVEITDIPSETAKEISDVIFAQRRSLEDQVDAAIAAADTAAAAVPTPTPLPTNPEPTTAQKTAFDAAVAAANTQKAQKRAEKMKPIRDKFESALREVAAEPALAAAVAQMKTEDEYKAILDKRAATPQQVTEDEYLTLLAGLTAKIQNNVEASRKLQAILTRVNK